MSHVKKQPRHEVISLRLTKERRALLERYRKALSNRLSRAVSMAEAAFFVLEDRVEIERIDHAATRHELGQTPTASLDRIRKRWASEHTLSAAEWDVLAEYVQIATEEARQEPPQWQSAVPSRESYLALLDAFETVYQQRAEHASSHAWAYVANLNGGTVTRSEDGADQRHHAVLTQIAHRRRFLGAADAWQRPGNIGCCLRTAIRGEGVDAMRLNELLAPHWPTLWGLAARGHWVRHDGQPVRTSGASDWDVRRRITLPDAITLGDLSVSFMSSNDTEFDTKIDFGPRRGFRYVINRYPKLVELRAMLEAPGHRSWHGRTFRAMVSKDTEATTRTLWFERDAWIELAAHEWTTLRDLIRQAWQSSDLQRWILALQ